MATVKKSVKKAQAGASAPKKKAVDSVKSEMFPGKMIPKSKSNFENRNFDKTANALKPAAKKAKSGGSFPDLNKDGKITKADILKGRGVIAKKGMKVRKAQAGKALSPAPKKKGAMDAVKDLGKYVSTFGLATEKYNPAPSKAAKKTPKQKMGGKTKKCAYGCK